MAQKKNSLNKSRPVIDRDQMWGLFYLALFVLFIIAGIFVKRVLGYPEFMMMFHLPAAVFLVFAGKSVSAKMRQNYLKQSQEKL